MNTNKPFLKTTKIGHYYWSSLDTVMQHIAQVFVWISDSELVVQYENI